MKRKIFSKLLMGAFLIASVSSFVSCKDYDDDINNLQKQIDAAALKAELTTLQTNLAAQIAAAQSAAQAAQAAAEKAQATANNAATKDALEAVKTLATAAGTDAAKAIADAANAQNTADVAKSAAQAAQEAAAAAQNVANGASDKAATALADAAKALATAESANATATAANATASAADATAKEAKATADNAIAAAGNATTQAADAVKAAGEAKAAAEAAKYNDEAVKILIAQAQASADAAAEDAKEAAEAAAAAVLASASATEDAATAKEAAAKAEETIATAIAAATQAIEEATDAKIKAAVAEAVAKIPTDQSEAVAEQAAAIETLKGNLQTLADAQGKLATAEGLAAAVEDLEGKLDATAEAAAVAAVAAAAGTIAEAFDALYSAVTSVELVTSFSAKDFDEDIVTFPWGVAAGSISSPSIDLDFYFGKMAWTATFGDAETENLDQDADEKKEYVEGKDIRTNMALLVRVNPTNATFTKDQVKFVNSKLETLDEIVEIGEPKRFTGMITRGEQQNGLWIIPVKVVDGTTFNKFNETTFYKGVDKAWAAADYAENDNLAPTILKNDLSIINPATGKYRFARKLYAIAINNTTDPEDADISRYVTSTYDIAATYQHYTPESQLDVRFDYVEKKVEYTDVTIGYIHNRWTTNVGNGEPSGSAGIRSYDQQNAYTLLNPEKAWKVYGIGTDEYKAGVIAPTSAETKPHPLTAKVSGKDVYNTQNDAVSSGIWTNEYRFYEPMLPVEAIGTSVKVYLPLWLQKKVEYWYISYDFELNAVESTPSEWEAWQSYKDGIDGIYKMARGSESIDLTINKETADGDVIGFRVWAVNYDGSLVDPDGRAFYVKIGDGPKKSGKTISADFVAVNTTKDLANISNLNAAGFTPEKGFNVSAVTTLDLSAQKFQSLTLSTSKRQGKTWVPRLATGDADDNTEALASGVYVYWKLLDNDGNLATNWKDIKKLVVGVDGSDLTSIVNDKPFDVTTITDYRTDANNKEEYSLTIQVKKVLPSVEWVKKNYYENKFTWHSDYNPENNTMTIYPKPYKEYTDIKALYPGKLGPSGKEKFYWRLTNDKNAAWKLWDFYDDANYLDWLKPAVAGIRQISDYNYKPKDDAAPGIDLSLYYFGFDKMSGNEAYNTYWRAASNTETAGNNTFVAALPSVIGSTKDAHLYYTFANVKTAGKSAGYAISNWTPSVWDFKASFQDALDLVENITNYRTMVYTEWEKNSLGAIQKKGTQYVVDNTLYIAWKNGTTTGTDFSMIDDPTLSNKLELYRLGTVDYSWDTGVDPETGSAWASKDDAYTFNPALYGKDYTNVGWKSDDITKFVYAKITESDEVLATGVNMGGLWSGAGLQIAFGDPFNPAYYDIDNPATTAVEKLTFTLEGDITTYLKMDPASTATSLKVFKVGGISDPKKNISGTLKMTGYDAFGKKHEIKVPVAIVFNF